MKQLHTLHTLLHQVAISLQPMLRFKTPISLARINYKYKRNSCSSHQLTARSLKTGTSQLHPTDDTKISTSIPRQKTAIDTNANSTIHATIDLTLLRHPKGPRASWSSYPWLARFRACETWGGRPGVWWEPFGPLGTEVYGGGLETDKISRPNRVLTCSCSRGRAHEAEGGERGVQEDVEFARVYSIYCYYGMRMLRLLRGRAEVIVVVLEGRMSVSGSELTGFVGLRFRSAEGGREVTREVRLGAWAGDG